MSMHYITVLVLPLAFTLNLLTLNNAVAQNLHSANLSANNKQLFMNIGLDPAVGVTVGFMHGVDCHGFEALLVYDLTLPMGEFDLQDMRFRWKTLAPIVVQGDWQLVGQFGLIGRTTRNDIYTGFNLGMDFGLAAGYYRQGWHVALEGGYDKSLLTHISHRDWYTENFYPDAVDGWYYNTGGAWRFGLTTSVKFDDTEVQLRAGMRVGEGDGVLLPPQYLTFGVAQTLK